jgi:hypothetical protein
MQTDKPEDRPIVVRKRTKLSCWTCQELSEDPMMPWHDASPRCESGHHAHCSCSICH